MTTFKEGDNTLDTVSFTSCTDTTLSFDLANSGSSYTISHGDGLDLELKHQDSTLTLVFQCDSSKWPRGASVSVASKRVRSISRPVWPTVIRSGWSSRMR